jgi:hypothetical protein
LRAVGLRFYRLKALEAAITSRLRRSLSIAASIGFRQRKDGIVYTSVLAVQAEAVQPISAVWLAFVASVSRGNHRRTYASGP